MSFIGDKELTAIHSIAVMKKLADLITDHSQWSQETFGTDADRGPIFALKHLEKEAKEAYEACEKVSCEEGKKELADCFLLILDAMRRMRIKFHTLVELAMAKLQVCKTRHYPKPEPGNNDAVEHDRLLEMRASDDGMKENN